MLNVFSISVIATSSVADTHCSMHGDSYPADQNLPGMVFHQCVTANSCIGATRDGAKVARRSQCLVQSSSGNFAFFTP